MPFLLRLSPSCLLSPPLQPPLRYLRYKYDENRRSSVKYCNKPSPRPPNSLKRPSLSLPLPLPLPAKSLNTLALVKPYLRSESGSILCGWICSFVSVASLTQIVLRFGSLTSNLNDKSASLVMLRREGFALAALVLAKVIAGYLQHAFLWDASMNAVYRIRVFVYQKVLERELRFFEGNHGVSPGDIAYRITAEASEVADTIYALLNTVIPSAFQISAMARQMVIASPHLTLISAMVIPLAALVVAYLGERLHKISRKAQLASASLSAYLNEVLPAILFVKANNAETSESIRFKKLAHNDLSARLKKKKMKSLIPQIVQIIYFGSLLIFCVGSLTISGSSLSSAAIVSFVTSLAFLIEPIQDLGKAYNEWKQGEPGIERLFDLTRFKAKVIEEADAIEFEKVAGEVKFSNVSFRYEDSLPPVLDCLNLHIRDGETIAIIGPSGGGKTTLVKLLLRLYELSSGSIFINKTNIKNIKLDDLRKHVGLVSQDTTLFSGTIAENIGYRDLTKEIDMEKIKEAARTANADEFINVLPHGYNTCVGPRGSSLSGGQKQRIAIARAIYKRSSILILDEATSALDSRSEALVRQALERLMQDHTVIVIAHRLETVLMAQRVFHLDNGKLKELNRSSLLDTHKDSLSSAGFVI